MISRLALPVFDRRALVNAALPVLCLLAWTCLVRLPFYTQTDKDEFFFMIVAQRWLEGGQEAGLPYVASFDVKPPGIFLIVAIAQALFGTSLATLKGLEIICVAAGAYGLFRLLRSQGSPHAAIWAAGLYPVLTLTLSGVDAPSMLVLLPFIIWSFGAALQATGKAGRWKHALVAGLLIGMAGMIKQTAIFEAAAVFAVLCLYGGERLKLAAAFVAGAALPAILFALYYLALGHFHELFEAVIVLAVQRNAPDVLASYGPASNFTFLAVLRNSLVPSLSLIVLWGGAMFAGLRYQRIAGYLPLRLLATAGLWLAFALAGVLTARGLCDYYLLAIIPPLLILAAALFAHGIGPAGGSRLILGVSAIAAVLAMGYIDRGRLFRPTSLSAGDRVGELAVAHEMEKQGFKPGGGLLVLNRGYGIYALTGGRPASVYFHATHLLGVFHTPSPDPLGEALSARPEFIVVADPALRHGSEQAARYQRVADFLARNYQPVGQVEGARDRFFIYRLASPPDAPI